MRGKSMDLDFKLNVSLNSEEVSGVFKKSGIKRPVDNLERIQRMLDHADVTVSAWYGPLIVGVARAITDYSYCCYLSDLAVDTAYQKKGIGKEMVRILREF